MHSNRISPIGAPDVQDSAALSNTDYVQLEELFQQLLKAPDAEASAQNCLADNRYSGVCCSAAIRDLSLTKCAHRDTT